MVGTLILELTAGWIHGQSDGTLKKMEIEKKKEKKERERYTVHWDSLIKMEGK